MPISRRAVLALLSSSTFFLSASAAVGAALPGFPAKTPRLSFPQGVASGDPKPDAVMLWTRALPVEDSSSALSPGVDTPQVHLMVQLSSDSQFSTVLLQAELHTSADSDYTVRAYVDGLQPDTTYFYRFLGAAASVSRTGRTRTAPDTDQARTVNLAFVSCQSYEQAYYGSWARMLADDAANTEGERIAFVLHLGDFIYERSWHTRIDGSPNSRAVPPFPDGVQTPENRYAVSLADYRHLYQTYLNDPHLQEARARWPFICTWDDHEFANNNFQSYSTYDTAPLLEAQRKQSSSQAWFEYIPSVLDMPTGQPAHNFVAQPLNGSAAAQNQAALDSLRIYRKLAWGKHLDILLTDSRSYRSPPCLPDGFAESLGLPMNTVELVAIADAGNAYADGNPPATLPYGDGTTVNPAREREPGTMLGLEQRDWLLGALADSAAQWKLWGNAMPLIPMRLDMSALPFTSYQDSIFNIDGWAGYPFEVHYLMTELKTRDITGVVSLSGDHHMQGAGTVSWSTTDAGAIAVCADFNVTGISSSPLFEELLSVAKESPAGFQPIVYSEQDGRVTPVWNMSMLQGVFAAYTYAKSGLESLANWLGPNAANPGLKYVDTTANGYGLASFSADQVQVKLITMEDCRTRFTQAPAIKHVAKFQLDHWQGGQQPIVQGPEFDGDAPFPFATGKV
ncbi:MAG: alkaline phosphatase D family protein [Halioglobus sp.]